MTAAGADECVFGQRRARTLQRNRPNVRTIQPSNVDGLGHRDGRVHQFEHALTTLSGAAVRERRGRKDLHGLEGRKRNQHDDRKHHTAHRAITYRRRAKGSAPQTAPPAQTTARPAPTPAASADDRAIRVKPASSAVSSARCCGAAP